MNRQMEAEEEYFKAVELHKFRGDAPAREDGDDIEKVSQGTSPARFKPISFPNIPTAYLLDIIV